MTDDMIVDDVIRTIIAGGSYLTPPRSQCATSEINVSFAVIARSFEMGDLVLESVIFVHERSDSSAEKGQKRLDGFECARTQVFAF